MSLKRRNTSSPESDYSRASKRQRPSPIGDDTSAEEEEYDEEDDDEQDGDETSFQHHPRHEQPTVHSTYGQKSAFPGLDDGEEDQLIYGPPSDGIEYLRMVRAEANTVPDLLVAPQVIRDGDRGVDRSAIDREPAQQADGYYADGAYTAPPLHDPSKIVPVHRVFSGVQDAYYASLSSHFRLLRATLRCTPPLAAIKALDLSHPISFPPESRTAEQQWRHYLQTTDPQTAQLACMDMESLLGVIRLLTGMMAQVVRSRNRVKIRRFGAWSWGVLGRCNDRGELGSEEIAELRELGKRAGGMLDGLRQRGRRAEDSTERLEAGDVGAETDLRAEGARQINAERWPVPSVLNHDPPVPNVQSDEAHVTLEDAKAKLRLRLTSVEDPTEGDRISGTEPKVGDVSTGPSKIEGELDEELQAMLDTIITVVGEIYGQRDLLESRHVWGERADLCMRAGSSDEAA